MIRSLTLLLLLSTAQAAVIRIGDSASVPKPEDFDPAWPEMAEWAKAGVRGGIPPRAASPIVERVAVGGDIQAALDRAGAEARTRGCGPEADGFTGKPVDQRYVVVLLADGTHEVGADQVQDAGYSNQPTGHMLFIPPGVILRGSSRDGTVILFDPPKVTGVPEGRFDGFHGVRMVKMKQGGGLEDLTIRNKQVMAIDYEQVRRVFHKHPGIDTLKDLPVLVGQGVTLGRSDSFMQNCAVLDMATCPVNASGRHHTCRDNLVERSYHTGPQGNGYYHTSTGHHSLFYNETVRDLRHFAVQGVGDPANRYHVFVHLHLEVDFNLHNGTIGGILVQDCHIAPPGHHPWARNDGFQGYKEDFADRNVVWRIEPHGPQGIGVLENPGKIDAVARPALREPACGSLYAVTGRHLPRIALIVERARQDMKQLASQGRHAAAFEAATLVRDNRDAGEDGHAEAVELLAELTAEAGEAREAALAEGEAEDLLEYLREWGGLPGAEPVRAAADARGEQALDELLDDRARGRRLARKLLDFIEDWADLPVTERAAAAYDELAVAAAADIRDSDDPERRAKYLQDFFEDWREDLTPGLAPQRQAYAAALQALFDAAMAETGRKRGRALVEIVEDHPGTAAAQQARVQLEKEFDVTLD